MSNPADEVDESAFGSGGESSADADYEAAFGDQATSAVGGHTADESAPDSHLADIDAAYDDPGKSGTGISEAEQKRAELGY